MMKLRKLFKMMHQVQETLKLGNRLNPIRTAREWVSDRLGLEVSNDRVWRYVHVMIRQTERRSHDGKPPFEVLVGIAGGGVIVREYLGQNLEPLQSLPRLTLLRRNCMADGRRVVKMPFDTGTFDLEQIRGKHVAVVEGCIRSGATVIAALEFLQRGRPASITLIALMQHRDAPVKAEICGCEVRVAPSGPFPWDQTGDYGRNYGWRDCDID